MPIFLTLNCWYIKKFSLPTVRQPRFFNRTMDSDSNLRQHRPMPRLVRFGFGKNVCLVSTTLCPKKSNWISMYQMYWWKHTSDVDSQVKLLSLEVNRKCVLKSGSDVSWKLNNASAVIHYYANFKNRVTRKPTYQRIQQQDFILHTFCPQNI